MIQRTIFAHAYWREFWIDLVRSRKDKRARKSLLWRTALLAYFVGVIWFYGTEAYSFHDPVTAVALGIIFVLISSIFLAVRWSQKREEQRQLADDIASADPQVTRYLQRLTYGLAALNERASSELFLHVKTLPEGVSITTRRIHLDSLRANGVWDDLPLRVRIWLMKPDGSWPPHVALRVLSTAEKLHTMLWALAITRDLRPLEGMEKPIDFAVLGKLLAKPAPGIRPTWDLRIERNKTQPYFFRLYAEGIYRGQYAAVTEEQAASVENFVRDIVRGEASEFLSGTKTVAELNDEALARVATSAACRYQILSMLLDSLTSEGRWNRMAVRLFGALPRISM